MTDTSDYVNKPVKPPPLNKVKHKINLNEILIKKTLNKSEPQLKINTHHKFQKAQQWTKQKSADFEANSPEQTDTNVWSL